MLLLIKFNTKISSPLFLRLIRKHYYIQYYQRSRTKRVFERVNNNMTEFVIKRNK